MDYDILTFPYKVNVNDIVFHDILEGEPLSKQRPRFGKNGNVYTPEKTKNYEESVRWLMRQNLMDIEPDAKNKFSLRCLFYRSTRQRIDCDNLIKAISDAANGQIWKDDAQVMEIFGRLFLASDRPRAEILIFRVDDPSPRDKCLSCGKDVITFPSVGSKYCSVECYNAANQQKRVMIECEYCHKLFSMPVSLAARRKNHCSRECAIKHAAEKKKENGRYKWKCIDCGCQVSRKEYIRCQSCAIKHRQSPTSNYWKLRYGIDEQSENGD